MKKVCKIILNVTLIVCTFTGLVLVTLWYYPQSVTQVISSESSYQPVPITSLTMRCFEEKLPVHFSYCINHQTDSDNKRVMYHFHGRKGNALWWNDDTYYSGELYRQWKLDGKSPPTVISISLGPLWLFNDDKLTVFFEQLMPIMELKVLHVIKGRFLVGESMGGVNALTVWAKGSLLFDGVAALCPPLPTISPYAKISEILDYFSESSTSWKRGLMLILMGRSLFESTIQWMEVDALQVISNRIYSPRVPLYLSCGKKDEWGCMTASTRLVEVAKRKGHVIEWHPREGGHCDIDTLSLAKFLLSPVVKNN